MPAISEFYVTFGVMYGRRPDDEKHPVGMHSDEFATIEAPDWAVAHAIASAVFGRDYAFVYDKKPDAETYTGGEALRIAWIDRARAGQLDSVAEWR